MARVRTSAPSHWWYSIFLTITIPMVLMDAAYSFLRPRSLEGGDLHSYFKNPYDMLSKVDYLYGSKGYRIKESYGYLNAQSILYVFEALLNITYLYKQHIVGAPNAPVIGLIAATITSSKKAFYFAQEYFCNYCNTGHNNAVDFWASYVLGNGVWLLVPGAAVIVWFREISAGLRVGGLRSKTE